MASKVPEGRMRVTSLRVEILVSDYQISPSSRPIPGTTGSLGLTTIDSA
jgi:hypothetical protein